MDRVRSSNLRERPRRHRRPAEENEAKLLTVYNMVHSGCNPLQYRTTTCLKTTKAACTHENCFYHHEDDVDSKRRTVAENAKDVARLTMYLIEERAKWRDRALDLKSAMEASKVDATSTPSSSERDSALDDLKRENEVLKKLLIEQAAKNMATETSKQTQPFSLFSANHTTW